MSYDFFLLYLSAFIGIGVALGLTLLFIAYKNRIAIRSVLNPIRIRRTHALVRPIALRGSAAPSAKA
ncbi:MAG: hypothetical protein ABIR53_03450 [Paraperlucidibaca sp.]